MKKWRVTGRCGSEQERIQEEAPYIGMWVHMSESWHPVTKKSDFLQYKEENLYSSSFYSMRSLNFWWELKIPFIYTINIILFGNDWAAVRSEVEGRSS